MLVLGKAALLGVSGGMPHASAKAASDSTCDYIDDDVGGFIDEDCTVANPTDIGASQLVNANINGQGPVAHVGPGAALTVAGNTYLAPSPGCARQLYVGIAANPVAGTPSQGSTCFNYATSLSYSANFTAPAVDGVYSAFWRVNLVTVGADYEANRIRSAAAVRAAGLPETQTDLVVNCPVTEVADA